MNNPVSKKQGGLTHYLSLVEVWALSVGCAVGWGAFVMPGTTFLPLAGPMGTAFGIAVGAMIMMIIGMNYHYLMNKYPDAGGTLTYSLRTLGFDHGLLSTWFLILVYVAMMWANATAIVLIVRNVFGDMFQWGFNYIVAGYHVYLGEIVLTLVVILGVGLICLKNKRTAIILHTFLTFVLIGGVFICSAAVLIKHGGIGHITPSFSPSSHNVFPQIASIVVLSPWAFVGFESISNSTQGFRFSPKKSIWIMLSALFSGALCYILLTFIASSTYPEGYGNWTEYINNLSNLHDISAIPVFFAVNKILGRHGFLLLTAAVTGGILTGLIGNYIAASRLIYSMTQDSILPEWFGRLDTDGNPSNAILFLMSISIFVPFVGRAAIGWIVDLSTIGALIAYTYTSGSAYKTAKQENNALIKLTGLTGLIISVLFLLYFIIPNIWSVNDLSAESYMILIIWSICGCAFFYIVFKHDSGNRFGKTTIVWITLLFLIFFTSMLWLRQTTRKATEEVLNELNEYNFNELAEHNITLDKEEFREAESFLISKMDEVNKDMVKNSWIQMGVILISLIIMFKIYASMTEREKRIEAKRIQAEESSKAKSIFLSNMSHDIRTPMNAIIGYIGIAKKVQDLPDEVADYLEKIEFSSNHLLSLINDILDMSRIENGKMELCPEKSDLAKTMSDIYDLFITQMENKGLSFSVNTDGIIHRYVYCDTKRLNRVLLNLLSNAYKFTPEGGSVTATVNEVSSDKTHASYEFCVKDTGMGMGPEFLKTIFEAYSRDKSASEIQGTGLGMAITKSIVELMNGSINVQSEKGKGTTFSIRIDMELINDPDTQCYEDNMETTGPVLDCASVNLLLVDDNEINRDIATLILEDAGFKLKTAENGKEALDIIASSSPGEYSAVLMDVQMPIMNGYEASRAIRELPDEKLSSIPIIAMTANAFADDVQNALDAGMNGHIPKPIDIDRIKEELSKALNGSL